MGAKGRQNLLLKFGELWKDRVADLAKLESLNNGTAVSLQSAVIEGLLNEIKYHSGWCDKIDGRVAGVDSNYHVYTTYEPIGVCGLVIAWNLPLWCIIVKMIPCLAMGNTCIIKPAEQTPLTALKLAEMLNEVGFPPGVVNIIPGYGPTAGSALAHHMKVRKIAFTGSTEVGRLMIKASADSNLKQVQLELGGKSPLIIFPDVNVDEAVEIASYVFCNNGQVCDSCSRTFVHEDIYDEFVQKAIEKARALKVGDPLDTTTDIGPLVCAEQYDRVRSYIELAQREGANIAYGGRDLSKEVYDGKGYFVEPTIFTNVTEDMTIFKEEIFGPCQTIIKFSDHKQVLESANNTQYGLAGGVISSNIANIFSITRNLKAGTVWGNCYATCMPEAEFGGVKHSGFGRGKYHYILPLFTHSYRQREDPQQCSCMGKRQTPE